MKESNREPNHAARSVCQLSAIAAMLLVANAAFAGPCGACPGVAADRNTPMTSPPPSLAPITAPATMSRTHDPSRLA